MYRFIVVCDPDQASGFRLAGVEVMEITDPGEGRKVISSLLHRDDAGIIAVNEDFMSLLDEKVMDKIEKTYRPIIIPIPSVSRNVDQRSYIERLIRKAIGYNIVVS